MCMVWPRHLSETESCCTILLRCLLVQCFFVEMIDMLVKSFFGFFGGDQIEQWDPTYLLYIGNEILPDYIAMGILKKT